MIQHKNDSKNTPLKNLALTSIGWELALPIFGGLLIGYQIDQHFATGFRFTLILLIAGVLTGYYSLFRYIELEMLRKNALDKRKEEKDQPS